MKKALKSYLFVWVILFALFQVIAFVGVGTLQDGNFSASFWIGYILIDLSFIGQFLCTYMATKGDSAAKTFYNMSLMTAGYSGLIASFVFGGLCMLIPGLPYFVSVIVCALVLACNILAVVKAKGAIEAVEAVDQKVKAQTAFIKLLTVDADTLIAKAGCEEIKAECRKVYEAVRYSDPMSSDALATAESQITLKFAELSDAVAAGDLNVVQAAAREVIILVEDRNKKCKLLK